MVAAKLGVEGYDEAGYTDFIASDGKVYGQVRQTGIFSFVRIYESGHEVPFYQPLASLEMFERVIRRRDVATGRFYLGDFEEEGEDYDGEGDDYEGDDNGGYDDSQYDDGEEDGSESWASNGGNSYRTNGPFVSTFREGNGTVQLEVLSPNATYNPDLNGPNPTPKNASSTATVGSGGRGSPQVQYAGARRMGWVRARGQIVPIDRVIKRSRGNAFKPSSGGAAFKPWA